MSFCPGTPETPKPNILVFMTDHQRGETVLPEHPAITSNVVALAPNGPADAFR